tara:strand:+ start:4995 stop:5597 length:603 start_codon:yes stop_codon:yes gene_type:complete
MDPFYLNEPTTDIDNFRPVEYEERNTFFKLGITQSLMAFGPGSFAVSLDFQRGWRNRKHTKDEEAYFEYNFPMTPYQLKTDYIEYDMQFSYFIDLGAIQPHVGIGGEFKIEQISSRFIYIDNQTNASANPYAAIPVDEHVERRFAYYIFSDLRYRPVKHFWLHAGLRLYFNEIDIDEKMLIGDRTDDSQLRPFIGAYFAF